ncbi:MAG TPA: hypothetical protein VKQ31_10825 [Steroidobacteraceae bacterium]|nr:hypothetical protein [Steroidobacteraceae bacterium]
MSNTLLLRVPAWLAGATVALIIAAAVRVAEAAGLAGIVELVQLLVIMALCASTLVLAERFEAQLADGYWPGPRFRKLVFLVLLVALDGYLALIFLHGGRFGLMSR